MRHFDCLKPLYPTCDEVFREELVEDPELPLKRMA